MYRGRYLEALYFSLFLAIGIYSTTTLRIFIPDFDIAYVSIVLYVVFPVAVSIVGIIYFLRNKETLYYFLVLDAYWAFTVYDTLFEVGLGSPNFPFASSVMALVIFNIFYLFIRLASGKKKK
jgi:hypothetical protein